MGVLWQVHPHGEPMSCSLVGISDPDAVVVPFFLPH